MLIRMLSSIKIGVTVIHEFFRRINRLASALLKIGVGVGDKVAFICPNIPPMLEAHFAVPMIGAALVSINIRLSSQEILYIIKHSDAKVLFVDNEFFSVVKPILNELTAVRTLINICDLSAEKPLDGVEYEEFLNTGSDVPVEISVKDEYEVASINYTSGTTGSPKGVMYHHRGAYLKRVGRGDGDRVELQIGIPVDIADVSLQRVVFPMGCDSGWRYTCLFAKGCGRGNFSTGGNGKCFPSLRRSNGSDRYGNLR